MTNLTVELVQQKLLEKDEMKKVSYKKQQLSKHRKSKEVKDIKDPSSKLTKITQVTTPKEEGQKEDKGKNLMPQSKFAHEYTDKMPHGMGPGTGGKGKGQKSPKLGGKTKSMKPNQQTKLKQVKDTIKGTEDGGGDKKAMTPGDSDFAYKYTDDMPHGSKTLGTANGEGGQGIDKPAVAKMAGGPTRAGGTRQAKNLGEEPGGHKKTTQISHKGNELPQPSDAMKWRDGKFQTNKQGHNVVESGVALKLGGRTKAQFEIISQTVLKQMVENYAKHGYKLVKGSYTPSWKTDKTLMALLRETMHAKHNFVPGVYKTLRKASLQRFNSLVSGSHNDLYEDRKDFVRTVLSAFSKIEEMAEAKYLKGLQIFECTARITVGDSIGDLEIVTEAVDHGMALRQVRNQIAEEFGLDADINHVFVDGQKYTRKTKCDYGIREQVAMNAYRQGSKKR